MAIASHTPVEPTPPEIEPETATPADSAAPATPARSRRALLTAALGGLGGLLASRLGTPDAATAAAGDPLLVGNTTNSAGTANTSLTTASAGTALLVTQNGSGTALRGSAVGPGSIAGFFTAANGTGISGVTASPGTYGVYGANNGAAGTGAAMRAAGGANHGLVATTAGAGANAVRATTASTIANAAAIYGEVSSTAPGADSAAVRGVNNGSGGNGIGVWGSQAGSGYGVSGTSSLGTGVRGDSTSYIGVNGFSDSYIGVNGFSTSYIGVYGDSSGSGIGVYGGSGGTYAGFFDGPLYGISLDAGSASATVKAFRIDHPVDPAGKILMHSCVESNERLTVYAGTVTTDAVGEAIIELPPYFSALNRDLRYQLTVIGSFAQAMVKHEVKANRFSIATSEPGTKVCWQVSGVRQDAYAAAHPLVVEAAKTGKDKGKYLNPVEHGQPESKGVDYELRQRARRDAAARTTPALPGGSPMP